MHRAVAIGDDRGAIEHQRILPADRSEQAMARAPEALCSSASRCACLSRSNGEAFGTSTTCAPFATVEAMGSANHRSSQITVTTGTPVDLEHAIVAVRVDVEIAALVEHRVVRQFALAVGLFDAAIARTLAAL